MTLIEIADLIFNNSTQVSFGTSEIWADDTFKANWFKNQKLQRPNAGGLYWFLTDATITDEIRPQTLTAKGCDFGLTSRTNLEIFHSNLLTNINSLGLRVIYNGHENNVMDRVRQHFSLSNQNTGALGIRHYNLSDKNWILKYFTINDISSLRQDQTVQQIILNLLQSKTGRIALENAWRIQNGWPILCKE